jgi:hypothetical protein
MNQELAFFGRKDGRAVQHIATRLRKKLGKALQKPLLALKHLHNNVHHHFSLDAADPQLGVTSRNECRDLIVEIKLHHRVPAKANGQVRQHTLCSGIASRRPGTYRTFPCP